MIFVFNEKVKHLLNIKRFFMYIWNKHGDSVTLVFIFWFEITDSVFKYNICCKINVILYSGVSCDSCLKGNFRGKRYKCLVCYDYDLCATCYEAGATTTRHTTDHAMQCIITRNDFGN